ncbi:hypothetical protein HY251_07940 [bacterium]|nr:hypothetical protein [bacterium]
MKCRECGNENAPGASKCVLCHAALADGSVPVVAPSPAAPAVSAPAVSGPAVPAPTAPARGDEPVLNLDRLRVDAEMRLGWGRSRESVEAYLVGSGLARELARDMVSELLTRKNRSYRLRGVLDLLKAAVALGFLALFFPPVAAALGDSPAVPRSPKQLLFLGVLALAGGVFLARGIFRLLFGGRGEGRG